MGERACKQLTFREIEDFWPAMLLELRKISHLWDMWWTEESLHHMCMTGMMQVWVAGVPPTFHIVVITQICVYPAGSTLQGVLGFGTKVDEVIPLLVETLEHYAQKHECRYTEIVGRLGWEKKLERFGYRPTAKIYSKPLGELRRH